MDDRTCKTCGKTFQRPNHLRTHMRRKTPCAPILENEDLPPEVLEDPDLDKKQCRFCGRVFSTYTSMRRHVRTSCRIAPNEKNGDTGMNLLYEHTIRKQEAMLEAQQAQIAEMMGLMREMRGAILSAPQTTAGEVALHMGDENHVAVDNRHIHINIFGQERLDHATAARIKVILDESMRAPALPMAASTAVLKTAMLVYSDPDHPENLTAYLPNKKTDDVLVHASRGGTTGWEVQPASLVLPPMAQKSVDTLFDKQPYENADEYGPLMAELAENEKRYTAGSELRPVLVRNKALLARALESLPVAGQS